MPLSPKEQELIDELERSLNHDKVTTAKFAKTARGGKFNGHTKLVLSILLIVAGIAVLVGGVIFNITLVGLLGFVVMFVGTSFVIDSLSSMGRR